jgi:hypothetical protein
MEEAKHVPELMHFFRPSLRARIGVAVAKQRILSS